MSASFLAANLAAHALAWPVACYINTQRDRLADSATPLSNDLKLRLKPYFADADLARVRIVQADPLPIPDPPFYPTVRRLHLDFPRPSLVAAITFDEIIATRKAMTSRLLFHEMVHVVQYRVLGVQTFARLYVRGFLAGGSYEGIPLERCAFDLEQRFVAERDPFRVEAEVYGWLGQGLF